MKHITTWNDIPNTYFGVQGETKLQRVLIDFLGMALGIYFVKG